MPEARWWLDELLHGQKNARHARLSDSKQFPGKSVQIRFGNIPPPAKSNVSDTGGTMIPLAVHNITH